MKTLLKTLWEDPKAARKFLVALATAIGTAVSLGLLPVAVGAWVAVGVSFVGALGVYVVPNKTEKRSEAL